MKQFIELNDGSLYVTVRLSEVVGYKHENAMLTVYLRSGGQTPLVFVLADEDCIQTDTLDAAFAAQEKSTVTTF